MGPPDVYKHNRIGRTASGIAPTRCSCAVKSGCSPLALTRAWTVCLIANPQQVFPLPEIAARSAKITAAAMMLQASTLLNPGLVYFISQVRKKGLAAHPRHPAPCKSPFDNKKDALVTKHLSGRSAGWSSCSRNHPRLSGTWIQLSAERHHPRSHLVRSLQRH
jgi:hypothetical protein